MVRGGAGSDGTIVSHLNIDNLMAESIAAGSAMAPFPVSPHASFLEIGDITVIPRSSIAVTWRFVKGLVHMSVFIAGATNMGFEKSQARTMHVRRLSQRPPATCTSKRDFKLEVHSLLFMSDNIVSLNIFNLITNYRSLQSIDCVMQLRAFYANLTHCRTTSRTKFNRSPIHSKEARDLNGEGCVWEYLTNKIISYRLSWYHPSSKILDSTYTTWLRTFQLIIWLTHCKLHDRP